MNCNKCGSTLLPNDLFCNKCGNKIKKKKDITLLLKKLIIVALLVIIILLLILLLKNQIKNKPIEKRTVMIYMVGSNLEEDAGIATADINSIDYSNIDFTKLNVLLYTGGTKKWHNFIENDENAIYSLTSNGFEKVKTYEITNMGLASTLSTFLDYGFNNYKADKYDLLFWNHGGAIQGAIYDDYSGDNLSLKDFDDALKNSNFNSNNKLETVIFRTCLNGTLEVANTFAPYTDYLVASEEVTLGSAKSRALEFINNINLKDTGIDIGKKFVDSYVGYIKEIDPFGTVISTYSIMNLNKIGKVNEAFNKFIKKINIAEDYDMLSRVRSNVYQYASSSTNDYDMIDLYSFVEKISDIDKEESKKLLDAINEVVVYNQVNEKDSHGISIYFPYNGTPVVESKFMNVYSELNFNSEYYELIKKFTNIKNNGGTSNFLTFSKSSEAKVDNKSKEFSVKLTNDQSKSFAKASYIIFRKEDKYYSPLYTSSEYELSSDGILSTKLNDRMLKVVDNKTKESSYIFASRNLLGDITTPSTLYFYDFKAGLFMDYEFYSATTTIKYDKDNKPYIASHVVSNSEKDVISSTILDENDFTQIWFYNPIYNILDKNGNYNKNWESSGKIGVIEMDVGNYSLENASLDDDGEYYCVFIITDTQNKTFYSKLVKIN